MIKSSFLIKCLQALYSFIQTFIMPHSKEVLKIAIVTIALFVFSSSQTQRKKGRNSQPNRQQGDRQENDRRKNSNQRQRKPFSRRDQQEKIQRQARQKIQRQQAQKKLKNNQQKELANSNNTIDIISKEIIANQQTQIKQINEQPEAQKDTKLYFQSPRHKNGDLKRNNLIKLLLIVALGLFGIVIILILKYCLKRAQDRADQTSKMTNSSIKNPLESDHSVPKQRFLNVQSIFINQNSIKLEIIKNSFLRSEDSIEAKNHFTIIHKQSQKTKNQSQADNGTFGEYTFRTKY